MKLENIISEIEQFAPLQLQESYDNAGLIIGNTSMEISSALLCIDVTEAVIDEAILIGAQLIISHHPLIFSGVKKINEKNEIERCVVKAIKNSIAIYAAHTNLDSVEKGVNAKICEKLALQKCKILSPKKDFLYKINTFAPTSFADTIQNAMFTAGAGTIGNYNSCSFVQTGIGTFNATQDAHPFVGEVGITHNEAETKIEVICPKHILAKVIKALLQVHPYEEPAYDIIPIDNEYTQAGAGMIGELGMPMSVQEFLLRVKQTFSCGIIRYSNSTQQMISRVAVCGGSGSFLISDAQKAKADIFLTGDIKYHDFFSVDNKMIIADIGHYESEQYTKEIFYEILNKKFPTFALHFSKVITNPINYL